MQVDISLSWLLMEAQEMGGSTGGQRASKLEKLHCQHKYIFGAIDGVFRGGVGELGSQAF